ncbi:5-oxoprolinase subunit PxpB [Hyunsoonleella pacifica]|uniref:5-oxoprolinase subunit PxpB n=1 Tax=Hyunsoonleella pacifica TaxID=1080224 RepID=A0A4Q9FL14_9FLAO|nr:5-oxoprolinase subunit PxpB [Hyunsoonleella pacifica]TBN13779.1 5-oxoprolinase subunit PxpB [Hyunsoonleella pacifica]GGD25586.1 allophanate hydrolase [Hyunsoonleella pacifica]
MKYKLKYKRFSETSILIEWPQKIEKSILDDILVFKEKIEQSDLFSNGFINHAYASLLLNFNDAVFDFALKIEELNGLYKQPNIKNNLNSRLWRIPVCYDKRFGIDLDDISKGKNIEIEELVKRHTTPVYTIFFIGFLPGFLYLGGLDTSLFVPRRAVPRLKIPSGSVAIGGQQTGIYPSESPGGWHIIGNSPINFFDVSKEEPCFSRSGDRLQFYAISLKEYNDIKTLVAAGVYQLKSEIIND